MLVRGGARGAEVSLSLAPDAAPCPSISVVVSEPAASLFRWELIVSARFPESTSRLGTIRTIAPAGVHPPNRVVLLAYAPGAVGWLVQCKAIPLSGAPAITDARADVWISRSECCGALTSPGVQAVECEGVGEPIASVATRQVQLFSAGASILAPANPFRRRLSIINRISGGNGGDVAIGPTIGVALATGRLLKNGDNFDTAWRGTVYGIGTAAGPAPYDGVSIWEEID